MEFLEGGYVYLYCKVDPKGKKVLNKRRMPAIDARGLLRVAPDLYSYEPFQEEPEAVLEPVSKPEPVLEPVKPKPARKNARISKEFKKDEDKEL